MNATWGNFYTGCNDGTADAISFFFMTRDGVTFFDIYLSNFEHFAREIIAISLLKIKAAALCREYTFTREQARNANDCTLAAVKRTLNIKYEISRGVCHRFYGPAVMILLAE